MFFPKDHFASTYALIAIPVRFVLENKLWEQAANLELPSLDFPWEKLAWEKAILHFGKSLGYSHIGDITSAENELTILQKLHQDLKAENETYKAGQVMIQINSAQAWIQLAKDNKTEALEFMKNGGRFRK